MIQKVLVDQLILNDPDFSKYYFRTQNCSFKAEFYTWCFPSSMQPEYNFDIVKVQGS